MCITLITIFFYCHYMILLNSFFSLQIYYILVNYLSNLVVRRARIFAHPSRCAVYTHTRAHTYTQTRPPARCRTRIVDTTHTHTHRIESRSLWSLLCPAADTRPRHHPPAGRRRHSHYAFAPTPGRPRHFHLFQPFRRAVRVSVSVCVVSDQTATTNLTLPRSFVHAFVERARILSAALVKKPNRFLRSNF